MSKHQRKAINLDVSVSMGIAALVFFSLNFPLQYLTENRLAFFHMLPLLSV